MSYGLQNLLKLKIGQMDNFFSKMKFKADATSKLGLPDIEYPIPSDRFPAIIMSGGEVKRELLIYWMLDYLSINSGDRELYEIQLLKCAEKFAVSSGQSEFWYRSIRLTEPEAKPHHRLLANWGVYLGNVDLKGPIVTIQNSNFSDVVYTSLAQFEDTEDLLVSCYTAPSLDTIEIIREYGKTYLSPERPFNSFDHLGHSTKKMGTALSSSSGNDYPVNWEYGLGWKSPTLFDDAYQYAQQLNPIPADWVRYFIRIIERVESDPRFRELVK